MTETPDHQNFHFGLFCMPNQYLITHKLLQNSPFFLITLYKILSAKVTDNRKTKLSFGPEESASNFKE